MSQQIKRYQTELKFLCNCSPSQRKKFMKSSPKKKVNLILKCLANISQTLLYNRKLADQLSPQVRKKLKRFIPSLRQLSKNSNGSSKQRFISSQKGGNLLSLIWNTLKQIF